MTEMITISKDDMDHLQERASKLALEKSHIELIIRLMNKMNATPGLDNTIESLLRQTLDVVGLICLPRATTM